MTRTVVSRRAGLAAPGAAVEPAIEHVEQKATPEPDASPAWLLPADIGCVEEGSLEEAIWRELGALPPSRRRRTAP